MAFKAKSKTRVVINNKQTIDATHQDMLDFFNNQKELLPDLKDELCELNLELKELKEESNSKIIIDLELQNKIYETEDKINELNEIIHNIENNEDEKQYMLNTSKLLNNYYNIQEKEKIYKNVSPLCSSSSSNKNLNKKKTVMDWFNSNENRDELGIKIDLSNDVKRIKIKKNKTITETKKTIEEIQKKKREEEELEKINHNKNNILKSKDKIYNDYMKIVDKNYVVPKKDSDEENIDLCSHCYTEMLLNQNTGMLICPKCGIVEKIIINSDKPSYKDPPKEQTSFCYKRINHLNEFLAQFQAKETTEIPEDVYNEILVEIKKERIENMAEITPDKMRLILRKIKRNDYYEHVPYIINQLNGLPPPVIAPEIEEIIRGMFKSIQIPFIKYCPNTRKNFLSYNYVMYKFFELLELDEYLNCFQLLKSRTKLHQQDQIWKNICKELGWEYIPSL